METEVRDEDAANVATIEITDDEFKSVHCVPCITLMMNRTDMQYEGEIFLSGDTEIDDARFQELLDVGLAHGQKVRSMEHSSVGGVESVLVYFTADIGISS